MVRQDSAASEITPRTLAQVLVEAGQHTIVNLRAAKMQAKHITTMGLISFVAAAMLAAPTRAEVATETATLGDYNVTMYVQPFLTDEDLGILRMVLTSQDALALFVPQANGFAAMAASPDDGFIKDGVPSASVVALGGLPDSASAAANAVDGCQKAKQGAADCVVILEIAPK